MDKQQALDAWRKVLSESRGPIAAHWASANSYQCGGRRELPCAKHGIIGCRARTFRLGVEQNGIARASGEGSTWEEALAEATRALKNRNY